MNKGVVLITVLIISVLLFVLVGTFLFLAMTARLINERYHENLTALGLAEAGVDYAIWEINFSKGDFLPTEGWSGTNPKIKTINNFYDTDAHIYGDINISVYNPGANEIAIISEGLLNSITGPTVRRKVQVGLRPHKLFECAILTVETINIGGNTKIDSYKSSLGPYGGTNVGKNGDVLTNGQGVPAIEIFGNAVVEGDAGTGPGGTVSVTGSAALSGTTNDNVDIFVPPVTVPNDLENLSSGGDLSLNKEEDSMEFGAGNYKYDSLRLAGKATITLNAENGPVNIYFTQTITTTAQSQIIVTNGEANIYFGGDMDIAGQGILNVGTDPSDLVLYGTNTVSDIDLAGIGEFYGTIYAPSADYTFTGSSKIYGGVVGKNLSAVIGNAEFHYDEQLISDSATIGYDPFLWQERY